ncbi:uncharacterized protein J3R85_006493 [Psidium guajava]|nr:uncharacterized protein J3R85_006493 [Psidium guajava]
MGPVNVAGLCLEVSVALLGGKTKLSSLFWTARAEMKRQVLKHKSFTIWSRNQKKKKTAAKKKKKNKKNQRFSFQYDPFSYALNFDNGNFGSSANDGAYDDGVFRTCLFCFFGERRAAAAALKKMAEEEGGGVSFFFFGGEGSCHV